MITRRRFLGLTAAAVGLGVVAEPFGLVPRGEATRPQRLFSFYTGGGVGNPTADVTAMRAAGFNTVTTGNYNLIQRWDDSHVGVDKSGSNASTIAAYSGAKRAGMKVVSKTLIDPYSSSAFAGDPDNRGWRATFRPADMSAWGDDLYEQLIAPALPYCDMILMETELQDIANDPRAPAIFANLVARIRKAAPHVIISNSGNEFVTGWSQLLDWVGVDIYWPMTDVDSFAQCVTDWQKLADQMFTVWNKTGKPIYFGELNVAGLGQTLVNGVPTAYTDSQWLNTHRAFFNVMGPLPYFAGFTWWRWGWGSDSTAPFSPAVMNSLSALCRQWASLPAGSPTNAGVDPASVPGAVSVVEARSLIAGNGATLVSVPDRIRGGPGIPSTVTYFADGFAPRPGRRPTSYFSTRTPQQMKLRAALGGAWTAVMAIYPPNGNRPEETIFSIGPHGSPGLDVNLHGGSGCPYLHSAGTYADANAGANEWWTNQEGTAPYVLSLSCAGPGTPITVRWNGLPQVLSKVCQAPPAFNEYGLTQTTDELRVGALCLFEQDLFDASRTGGRVEQWLSYEAGIIS